MIGAKLKNDTGDRKAADALLDLVDRTTEGVNRYRWDKVLVAHQMGRRDILERDLVWLAAEATGKTRDDALRNQVVTDPHSPRQYRVIGPMRNMDAWYAAFGVKPGDKLYLAPDERVRLW